MESTRSVRLVYYLSSTPSSSFLTIWIGGPAADSIVIEDNIIRNVLPSPTGIREGMSISFRGGGSPFYPSPSSSSFILSHPLFSLPLSSSVFGIISLVLRIGVARRNIMIGAGQNCIDAYNNYGNDGATRTPFPLFLSSRISFFEAAPSSLPPPSSLLASLPSSSPSLLLLPPSLLLLLFFSDAVLWENNICINPAKYGFKVATFTGLNIQINNNVILGAILERENLRKQRMMRRSSRRSREGGRIANILLLELC